MGTANRQEGVTTYASSEQEGGDSNPLWDQRGRGAKPSEYLYRWKWAGDEIEQAVGVCVGEIGSFGSVVRATRMLEGASQIRNVGRAITVICKVPFIADSIVSRRPSPGTGGGLCNRSGRIALMSDTVHPNCLYCTTSSDPL